MTATWNSVQKWLSSSTALPAPPIVRGLCGAGAVYVGLCVLLALGGIPLTGAFTVMGASHWEDLGTTRGERFVAFFQRCLLVIGAFAAAYCLWALAFKLGYITVFGVTTSAPGGMGASLLCAAGSFGLARCMYEYTMSQASIDTFDKDWWSLVGTIRSYLWSRGA